MKSDRVFKRAFNETIDLLAGFADGQQLPSENALSVQLRVSRTTVRKILGEFVSQGALTPGGGGRVVSRGSTALHRYPDAETVPTSAQVERRFMEWMLRDDTPPGATINELELARRFGVATTSIREFLSGFKGFGLIEKRPNSGWVMKGFTLDFALELSEVREMFELRSALKFALLPAESPLRQELDEVRRQHEHLLAMIDERFHDFSELDNRFHRLINAAAPNRFIDGFYDLITLIFHYHYQWNKRDERQRNEAAILEHLAYIRALQSGDLAQVESACRIHLASAKQTMIHAVMLTPAETTALPARR